MFNIDTIFFPYSKSMEIDFILAICFGSIFFSLFPYKGKGYYIEEISQWELFLLVLAINRFFQKVSQYTEQKPQLHYWKTKIL